MIKSKEEFYRIVEEKQFGENGKILINKSDEFFQYLKEKDRLINIIKIWENEQNEINEPEDLVTARVFYLKLRSCRRIYLTYFPESNIPEVKMLESLDNKIEEFRKHDKEKFGNIARKLFDL
jgi:hypothetical protein